jgi:hypothetical protein
MTGSASSSRDSPDGSVAKLVPNTPSFGSAESNALSQRSESSTVSFSGLTEVSGKAPHPMAPPGV